MAQLVKNPPANSGGTRDSASIPGLGRSPGGGNGNLFQYSCLENPMDKGACRATVHGLAKSRIWLSPACVHTHTHARAHTHTHTPGLGFSMRGSLARYQTHASCTGAEP